MSNKEKHTQRGQAALYNLCILSYLSYMEDDQVKSSSKLWMNHIFQTLTFYIGN